MTGALLAHGHLGHRMQPAIMHMRQLNAHVEAALRDWMRSRGASIPRQNAPAVTNAASAGTSSFGMSGINAHLVLAAAGDAEHSSASQLPAAIPWQRSRCWPLHQAHGLLQWALKASNGALQLACSPAMARLACLRGFQVSRLTPRSAPAILALKPPLSRFRHSTSAVCHT